MAKSLKEQLEELQKKVDAITAGRKGVDKCRKTLAKAAADYQDEYQKLLDSGLTVSTLDVEDIKPVSRVLYEMYRDFHKSEEKNPDKKMMEETIEVPQDTALEDKGMMDPGQRPYADVAVPEQAVPEQNYQQ